jgi:CheY-like chemotaxis protein
VYTYQQFVRDLRYTLNHFYEPNLLRLSPLSGVLGGARRQTANSTALQQLLTEAIEALRPPATTPLRSQAWRTYNLLLQRYLQQFSQEEVASQLGVSLRQLGREQTTALEALASYLWDHYAVSEKRPAAAGESVGAADPANTAEKNLAADARLAPEHATPAQPDWGKDQSGVTPDSLFDDLSWLQDQPVQRPTDFQHELSTTLEIAQPLVAQNGVRLLFPDEVVSGQLPGLAVHDVVLRELLLSVILAAVRTAPGSQVEISVDPRIAASQLAVVITCLTPPGTWIASVEDGSNLKMAMRLAELSRGQLEISTTDGHFQACLKLPVFELWTVLMVDDNRDLQELFQRYVAGSRYHIVGLADPAQMMPLVEKNAPRAILLDVMMPNIDGWQLLGQLRQHPLTQSLPVIVCTILAQKELALALGASDFLRKPVSQADLMLALDRLAGAPAAGPR